MIPFIVAVTLFLIVAVCLAHALHARASADTLGLRAARAAVVADFHRRIYRTKRDDQRARIAEAYARVIQAIEAEEASR